jgi:syntaxin 5
VAQELTYIIKQDIAALNSQIAQLQAFTLQQNPNQQGGKQVSEHNKNVVTMLQSKLADTTIGFKDVLEIRTQVSFCPFFPHPSLVSGRVKSD